MTNTQDAWKQVSDRMSALLLKLKLHTQEELSDEELKAKAGFDKLRAVVGEAMEAIEDAYEDQAVRDDAREAGKALVSALDATFSDIGERLRTGRS